LPASTSVCWGPTRAPGIGPLPPGTRPFGSVWVHSRPGGLAGEFRMNCDTVVTLSVPQGRRNSESGLPANRGRPRRRQAPPRGMAELRRGSTMPKITPTATQRVPLRSRAVRSRAVKESEWPRQHLMAPCSTFAAMATRPLRKREPSSTPSWQEGGRCDDHQHTALRLGVLRVPGGRHRQGKGSPTRWLVHVRDRPRPARRPPRCCAVSAPSAPAQGHEEHDVPALQRGTERSPRETLSSPAGSAIWPAPCVADRHNRKFGPSSDWEAGRTLPTEHPARRR